MDKPATQPTKSKGQQVYDHPYKQIIERMKNRPFPKHKLMTSTSVQDFVSDIFGDGLREEMVIFEPNFVKNYGKFSNEYLQNYHKYNTQSDNNDFLSTYDKIVQPKRWSKVYKSVNNNYTKNVQDIVFQDKLHQSYLFASPEPAEKPFEVFVTQGDRKKVNTIMHAFQMKIRDQIMKKTDAYYRGRLNAHYNRKQMRIEEELVLPQIGLEEKKHIVVEDQKKLEDMKRVLSEDMMKTVSRDVSGLNTFNQESTRISKDNKANHTNQSSIDLGGFQNQSSYIRIQRNHSTNFNNSQQLQSFDSSKLPNIINQRSLNQTLDKTVKSTNQPLSQQNKDHLLITSAILSLRRLTTLLMKEHQKKKDKNMDVIYHEVHLAQTFIKQLKDAPISQTLRLNVQVFDALTRIENFFELFKIDKEETYDAQRRKYLKASFLQKLEILKIQQNQLRNTDNKYKKYYEKPEIQQSKGLVKDYLHLTNPFHNMSMIKASKVDEIDNTVVPDIINFEDTKQDIEIQSQISSIKSFKQQNITKNKRTSYLKKVQMNTQLKKAIGGPTSQSNLFKAQVQKKPSKFEKLVAIKDIQPLQDSIDIQKVVDQTITDLQPFSYYDEVIKNYFGGQPAFLSQEDSEKQKHEIVESTIRDLIYLAKEDQMTKLKAVNAIENHIHNEKNLNFKQRQEKQTLTEFLKQLPNKETKAVEDQYSEMNKFYEETNIVDKVKETMKSNLSSYKLQQDTSYEALLYVQNLKMFYNENNLPQLLDQFIERNQSSNDLFSDQKKNMTYYRRQLEHIEQKLIAIIQKFEL